MLSTLYCLGIRLAPMLVISWCLMQLLSPPGDTFAMIPVLPPYALLLSFLGTVILFYLGRGVVHRVPRLARLARKLDGRIVTGETPVPPAIARASVKLSLAMGRRPDPLCLREVETEHPRIWARRQADAHARSAALQED